MLTVVFPMSLEIPGVLNKRKFRWIKAKTYQCLVIGVGKESTQKVLAKWLEDNSNIDARDIGQNRILLLGFCGGLDPNLRTGDMVLSTHYRLDQELSDVGLYRQCEPNLNMFFRAIKVVTKREMRWSQAPSLTTTHIVGTRVEKAKLWESCNAGMSGFCPPCLSTDGWFDVGDWPEECIWDCSNGGCDMPVCCGPP